MIARTAPRVAATSAVTAAVVASLYPSLLPRPVAVQSVLTGLMVALAYGLSRFRTAARGTATPRRRTVRWAAVAVGAALVAAAVVVAGCWQNTLRTSMALPTVGPAHWVAAGVGSAAVAIVLIGACRALIGIGRTRRGALVLAVATLVTSLLAPRLANAEMSPATPSARSSTLWETLDGHGRRFVTDSATATSLRVYVGLRSAPDVEHRVDVAIRELERSGAFARTNLVVAVPTGSGWVDASALAGFEERFGGDVAVVAVQYSSAPSWVTFAFDRESATATARQLYHAVSQRISRMPVGHQPSLYLYGQSLGAYGAAAVDTGTGCGTLLAGPPVGSSRQSGTTVLANASDPVVRWSPRLLLAPPDVRDVRPDAPTPQWIPGVSFLQTTVDLLTALDSAPGHGHRYGSDQGTAMPNCPH